MAVPLLKEPIPYQYVHWAKGNGVLFKRYVLGYLKKVRPDYKLVKIDGLIAICKKKEREDV